MDTDLLANFQYRWPVLSLSVPYTYLNSTFIIVDFSLAWVRLLIKGSSYSRVSLINFRPKYECIHKNFSTEDWFTKTAPWVIKIRSSKKLPCCSQTSQGCLLSWFYPDRASASTYDHDHTHLIEFTYACGYYFFY